MTLPYKSLLAALAIALSNSSVAALINFDDHAATSQVNGTPTASSVVSNDYASEGVVFGRAGLSTGVAVVNNSNTFSSPNGACGLNADGNIPASCAGDIYFNFVSGANDATTDSVSFVVGDSGGDIDSWVVYVYDIADNLLESRAFSSAANITQSFSHTGMHRFHIDWAASFNSGYLFDNLSFNTPTSIASVSEPSSFALLGLGLAALGLTRRRLSK